ncbi:MAG: Rpn family recombination-promoting nuclease/putative transposase, partial [Puniceicoccales bacterium]|nr:Rpn family recombination-promoting nuclease/putative transposase [Puniceicoccales bacterium]
SAGEVNVPLQGKKANATMDFHGITKNRDHVIIEMQILHHDNFDRRALFYAASTFANQQYEGGTEWHSQIKNVYAIQFVDYFTKDKEQGQFRKYYRMTDWLSEEKQVIEGISLIQVELAGIQILGNKLKTGKILTPAEWWYYVIENSESLTEAQIAQYKSLGMPQKLKDALEKLKFRGWEARYKKIYGKEIKEVDTYRLELARREQKGREEGEQKGREEGEMKGHIKGLIERFIYDENMKRSLKAIRNQEMKFPKELVEKVWNEYASQEEGIPEDKSRDEFMAVLRRENVLESGKEEGPVEESKEGK